jgi:hypothetical protein
MPGVPIEMLFLHLEVPRFARDDSGGDSGGDSSDDSSNDSGGVRNNSSGRTERQRDMI